MTSITVFMIARRKYLAKSNIDLMYNELVIAEKSVCLGGNTRVWFLVIV